MERGSTVGIPSGFEAGFALIRLLISPGYAPELADSEWDRLVRIARASRLLGTLRSRLNAAGVLASIPERVRQHLDSDYMLARFQRHRAIYESRVLAELLGSLKVPIVVLKGAAYIVQGLRLADGRFVSDLDIMVPRIRLEQAETTLKAAGWAFRELDAYDEHYYRAWTHELPPMRCPGNYLELDLHHTILPLTGRIRPNADALFESAVAVQGSSMRVLSPADQVLHACVHLAQDSDFADRFRDFVDVDALIREYCSAARFWDVLIERAALHGMERPLWYSLRYCRCWLGTPIPTEIETRLQRWAPPRGVVPVMDWLVARAALPVDPDRGPNWAGRLARGALLVRSHWLRMPPGLLARHTLAKVVRPQFARRPSAHRT